MSELKIPERSRRLRRERLDPAKTVVEKFRQYDPEKERWMSGESVLAHHMDCDPSVILRWMYPLKPVDGGRTRGSGGVIPISRHAEILAIAHKLGIELKQQDLYPRL